MNIIHSYLTLKEMAEKSILKVFFKGKRILSFFSNHQFSVFCSIISI